MSYERPKKPTITIDSVRFYFDAVKRDSATESSLHQRLAKWFFLKDKLMLLTDEGAEKVLAGVEALLESESKAQAKKTKDKKDTKETQSTSLKLLKDHTENVR